MTETTITDLSLAAREDRTQLADDLRAVPGVAKKPAARRRLSDAEVRETIRKIRQRAIFAKYQANAVLHTTIDAANQVTARQIEGVKDAPKDLPDALLDAAFEVVNEKLLGQAGKILAETLGQAGERAAKQLGQVAKDLGKKPAPSGEPAGHTRVIPLLIAAAQKRQREVEAAIDFEVLDLEEQASLGRITTKDVGPTSQALVRVAIQETEQSLTQQRLLMEAAIWAWMYHFEAANIASLKWPMGTPDGLKVYWPERFAPLMENRTLIERFQLAPIPTGQSFTDLNHDIQVQGISKLFKQLAKDIRQQLQEQQ
jgi:hypothetical protein